MACPLSFQVIGEYAYVTEEINMEDVLEKITSLMNNEYQGTY